MSLKSGMIVDGTVSGITKYGAFVKLTEDTTGLCHISEVSDSFVKDINNYLTKGQQIKVKILKIKNDNKIELSIKEANKNGDSNTSSSSSQPKTRPNVRQSKPTEQKSFENMMSSFLKKSEEKLGVIKQREKRF